MWDFNRRRATWDLDHFREVRPWSLPLRETFGGLNYKGPWLSTLRETYALATLLALREILIALLWSLGRLYFVRYWSPPLWDLDCLRYGTFIAPVSCLRYGIFVASVGRLRYMRPLSLQNPQPAQTKHHSSLFENAETSDRSALHLRRLSSLRKGLRSNISKAVVLEGVTSYYAGRRHLVLCKTAPRTMLESGISCSARRQQLILCWASSYTIGYWLLAASQRVLVDVGFAEGAGRCWPCQNSTGRYRLCKGYWWVSAFQKGTGRWRPCERIRSFHREMTLGCQSSWSKLHRLRRPTRAEDCSTSGKSWRSGRLWRARRSWDQDLSWKTLSKMRTPRFFIVCNPR